MHECIQNATLEAHSHMPPQAFGREAMELVFWVQRPHRLAADSMIHERQNEREREWERMRERESVSEKKGEFAGDAWQVECQTKCWKLISYIDPVIDFSSSLLSPLDLKQQAFSPSLPPSLPPYPNTPSVHPPLPLPIMMSNPFLNPTQNQWAEESQAVKLEFIFLCALRQWLIFHIHKRVEP